MRRELIRSSAFVRAARRYLKRRPQAMDALRHTLERLEQDAFDPRLKTHKLTGHLAATWACSGGYDLRVLFDFVEHEGRPAILLLTVGTHDEVY
ncbi:MAG: hypothetical protein KDA44_20265 [Planctomycetales bacterium]|nr:hypothetical protein [Planctomycetales bacterium]